MLLRFSLEAPMDGERNVRAGLEENGVAVSTTTVRNIRVLHGLATRRGNRMKISGFQYIWRDRIRCVKSDVFKLNAKFARSSYVERQVVVTPSVLIDSKRMFWKNHPIDFSRKASGK